MTQKDNRERRLFLPIPARERERHRKLYFEFCIADGFSEHPYVCAYKYIFQALTYEIHHRPSLTQKHQNRITDQHNKKKRPHP